MTKEFESWSAEEFKPNYDKLYFVGIAPTFQTAEFFAKKGWTARVKPNERVVSVNILKDYVQLVRDSEKSSIEKQAIIVAVNDELNGV